MANTYTQIYIHLIFATKMRYRTVNENFKESLQKYITGIINNKSQKLYAVNFHENHIHIFFSYTPNISLSELVKEVKKMSTNYINENKFLTGKFYWQEGYAAFSYSKSQIENVIKYVKNQQIHHKKKSFREEYIEMLKKFDVKYDEKYIFEEV